MKKLSSARPVVSLFGIICSLLASVANSQDWAALPVPASAGPGLQWDLDWNLSDEFNYDSTLASGQTEFFSKWQDFKPNYFLGPGATYFSRDNWFVDEGALTIFASRVPEAEQIVNTSHPEFLRTTYTSYITSKVKLQPNSYTEVLFKGGGTALATNFWMIDDADSTEIDVLEIYGDTQWYRERPRTNAILQIRENGALIEKLGTQMVHPLNGINYSQTWHRYGVHWKNTTDLDFYHDGELIRTLHLPNEITDPTGDYLDQDMRLILDMEAHVWRGEEGIPSDAELADWSINNMQVDWIRTYRAISADGDFDLDGDVDGADFLRWQLERGSTGGLAEWQTHYGVAASAAIASTVPEPSTLILLLVLALLPCFCREDHRRGVLSKLHRIS